jgi:hypothetical protein
MSVEVNWEANMIAGHTQSKDKFKELDGDDFVTDVMPAHALDEVKKTLMKTSDNLKRVVVYAFTGLFLIYDDTLNTEPYHPFPDPPSLTGDYDIKYSKDANEAKMGWANGLEYRIAVIDLSTGDISVINDWI